MTLEPSYALGLLGALEVAALLGGIWIGFRICTRDASLLARFATDAREARMLSDLTSGQTRALREEWEAFAEHIERKRKQTTTAAARARVAERVADEVTQPVPEHLTMNDRRRLVARKLNGGR